MVALAGYTPWERKTVEIFIRSYADSLRGLFDHDDAAISDMAKFIHGEASSMLHAMASGQFVANHDIVDMSDVLWEFSDLVAAKGVKMEFLFLEGDPFIGRTPASKAAPLSGTAPSPPAG